MVLKMEQIHNVFIIIKKVTIIKFLFLEINDGICIFSIPEKILQLNIIIF